MPQEVPTIGNSSGWNFQRGLLAALAVMGGVACADGPAVPDGMVLVPPGAYVPLFKNEGVVDVTSFWLDERPVTNGEFLEFVRANPAWRRGTVKRIFADRSYLAHWAGDTDLGPLAPSNAPVTSVSWFAARAFARAHGKRLPTVAEWEHAAAASETLADAREDSEFTARILRWYGRPVRLPLSDVGSTEKNIHGLWDLHGLVWEWVSDFNTALVTGESRADTGLERDLFCGSGAVGASSFRDYAAFMRYAFRSSLKANYTVQNLGFRCARDAPRLREASARHVARVPLNGTVVSEGSASSGPVPGP